MSKTTMLTLLILLGSAVALSVRADEPVAKSPPEAKSSLAAMRFEKLKSMAGEWTMLGEDGKPGEKPTHTYRVTAGGSAVLETVFPAQAMEMITLYHMDGEDLVLTHYCMLGNQPHMKAKAGGDAKEIQFECQGGTNISESDHHMHSAHFTFKSKDRVHVVWESIENGEPTHRADCDMHRMAQ